MRRPGKLTFYFGLVLIVCFFVCTVTGVNVQDKNGQQREILRSAGDIRWGVDVVGGVSVTFEADSNADGIVMQLLRERMSKRLDSENITDYELYIDNSSNCILVSFPWSQSEDGDAVDTIDYLTVPGCIRVIEGRPADFGGIVTDGSTMMVYDSAGNRFPLIMDSEYLSGATVGYDDFGNRTVTLSFNEEGTALLADGTGRQVGDFITVWLDGRLLSTMAIHSVNIIGELTIGKWGGLDEETAQRILRFTQNGALPVGIQSKNYEISDRAFADDTLHILIVTGIAAIIIVSALLMLRYRLPGVIAGAALVGHTAGLLAAASGFLPVFSGVTMTLPGLAGLIVSAAIGIDANIITAERIKDEILKGKSLHGSIDLGCRASLSSIFDGNVTILIVAVIIMGVFGPPDGICSILLTPFMWMFPRAATGTIYAFGYMLFFGVIFNFVFGVFLSRAMLRSASKSKYLHNRWLYGGEWRK